MVSLYRDLDSENPDPLTLEFVISKVAFLKSDGENPILISTLLDIAILKFNIEIIYPLFVRQKYPWNKNSFNFPIQLNNGSYSKLFGLQRRMNAIIL